MKWMNQNKLNSIKHSGMIKVTEMRQVLKLIRFNYSKNSECIFYLLSKPVDTFSDYLNFNLGTSS